MRRLLIPLCFLVFVAAPAAARADLNVYAASSLRSAFPDISGSPAYNFGASNTLQLQIERGAPADVFASASPEEAQALFRQGLCERPVTFATNILVMIVPNANPGHIRNVYSLRSGGTSIAIGAAGVPVGDYTRLLLRRLRLSSVLSSNTVSQEANVASVTSKVRLNSADAGFVYHTDALLAADDTKEIRLPQWAQPAVRYQICAVKRPGADTAGAHAYIRAVRSAAGRGVLRKYGFGLPPR
jgi:molybdate transport system substrate-binding protein